MTRPSQLALGFFLALAVPFAAQATGYNLEFSDTNLNGHILLDENGQGDVRVSLGDYQLNGEVTQARFDRDGNLMGIKAEVTGSAGTGSFNPGGMFKFEIGPDSGHVQYAATPNPEPSAPLLFAVGMVIALETSRRRRLS